jgi:superfamily I DNA/RNA helicase
VHQAKGLQWPVVFVPQLVRNRFPSRGGGRRTPSLGFTSSPSKARLYTPRVNRAATDSQGRIEAVKNTQLPRRKLGLSWNGRGKQPRAASRLGTVEDRKKPRQMDRGSMAAFRRSADA